MYRPHTTLRRRATTAPAAAALAAALIALSACGSDAAQANESSTATQAPAVSAATTVVATTQPAPDVTVPATEPDAGAAPATDGDEDRTATVRERREEMAEAALLGPDDLGAGWQDFGTNFPMTSELAATVPSCAAFVDVVFEGNAGAWAHAAFGRDADIAFTSVTVFATEAEAAAMVAAVATPEFDQCWADFNEASVVAFPFGIESASYDSVEPPIVELGGDSSSLHALEGTLTFGTTEVPDTCVCAFVQQGRTVVTFHAAAPVFDPVTRSAVIATALARVDEEVE